MADMAIPDARSDLNGALNFLITRVVRLEADIQAMKKGLCVSDVMTLADIAADQGIKASTLEKAPWKVPNFGRPDFGKRPGKWHRATYVVWMGTPEDERRATWDQMSCAERRKARGIG